LGQPYVIFHDYLFNASQINAPMANTNNDVDPTIRAYPKVLKIEKSSIGTPMLPEYL
jgi:hypothetical protein